jgi:transcriptional regulator with XRE-family HTH domain
MKEDWQDLPQIEIYKNIGKNLKETRKSFKYSQSKLAEKAGLSLRTIQRIESGEALNFDSLIRIFRVYNQLNQLQSIFQNNRSFDPFEMLKKLKNDN